jgi:hypothetical protein
LAVGSSPTFVALTLTNGQISFPASQVASAGANVLDDYEEGTWTVILQFGGANVGITYTTQTGTYTKMGNRVLIDSIFTLSSKGSSTGSALATGLPFTSGQYSALGLRISPFASALNGITSAIINTADTTVQMQYVSNAGTAITDLADTNFANNTTVILGGQYRV